MHRSPYELILPENPANSQKGKIIVITGAGQGLGQASANVWARAGALGIVLAGRRVEMLEETAKGIREKYKGTEVLIVQTDITLKENVTNLFVEVKAKFGRSADLLLANAGYFEDLGLIGDVDVDDWWNAMTVNVKGLFLCVNGYINAQDNPKDPKGTIISMTSGTAGMTYPTSSGYSVPKLAVQKFSELVHAEYPNIRMFAVSPGLATTPMTKEAFKPLAFDDVELTGMLALYLMQPRAEFLRGCYVSVNWDMEELKAAKEEILGKKLLKLSWLPVLPIGGGKGLN